MQNSDFACTWNLHMYAYKISKCLDVFQASRVPGFRGDGIHIGCISRSVARIQPWSVDIPFVFQTVLPSMTDFGVTSIGWWDICTGSHWWSQTDSIAKDDMLLLPQEKPQAVPKAGWVLPWCISDPVMLVLMVPIEPSGSGSTVSSEVTRFRLLGFQLSNQDTDKGVEYTTHLFTLAGFSWCISGRVT